MYVPCSDCGRGNLSIPDTLTGPCLCKNPSEVHMLLCRYEIDRHKLNLLRVLLGKPHVQYDYEKAQHIKSSIISSHNSVVCVPPAGSKRTREVLLYDHTLVYPEFIITYSRSNQELKDLVRIPSVPNSSLSQLYKRSRRRRLVIVLIIHFRMLVKLLSMLQAS